MVEPGDDCVDGVLLAVGVAVEEDAAAAAVFPNGAGSPFAGDCRICTGARTVVGALAVTVEAVLLTVEVATGDGCCWGCC